MSKRLSSLATAVLLGSAGVSLSAVAEAPMAKTQAPAFMRVMLGDFEVTTISDGTVKLPLLKLLIGQPEQLAAAFKKNFLKETVEVSVNAFLINTGSKLVLIDTGAAGFFGPTLGNIVANLKASGYQPEQVDEIYITHMHSDHVGGLMAAGNRAFPNATLRIDKKDTDYWLSNENMNAATESARDFFKSAMTSANPYLAAGKLKTFEGNTELVPGIRAVAAYGHTPGHTVYAIESKGEKLMLWGDLMHVAAVQFEDPSVTIQFDSNSKAAAEQRQLAFADAAKNGYLVGATHIAFPGLGNMRVANDGKGYAFVPLNYSSLK
jgi:glyoxylase-like metal-dependent hydrolase (beta-lactamase superfamily II)